MEARAQTLVLVLDEDDDVRRTCLDLLQARGHQAVGAASVGEGLRLFDERHPQAVLLDLKLPDGAGIDVLRELERRAPGTPVVVISGYAASRRRGRPCGGGRPTSSRSRWPPSGGSPASSAAWSHPNRS